MVIRARAFTGFGIPKQKETFRRCLLLCEQQTYKSRSKIKYTTSIPSKTNRYSKKYEITKMNKQDNPTVYFNMMILSQIKKNNWKEARVLFKDMGKKLITKNVYTYNVMLKGFQQQRDVESMVVLFNEMINNGVTPDIYSFNPLIDALGKIGKVEEMIQFFEKMQTYNITPTLRTFTSIIDALGKKREFELMFEWFEKMKSFNIQPDSKVLKCMTIATQNSQQKVHIDKCNQLISTHDTQPSKSFGSTPSTFEYNRTLSVLNRESKFTEAEAKYEEMKKSGVEMDVVTFTTMMKCYGLQRRLYKVTEVFEEMKSRGVKPDAQTFTTILHFFGRQGELSEMKKWFTILQQYDLQPNIFIFNTLITQFGKRGQYDEVVGWLNKMKEKGVTPDDWTLTQLQSSLSRTTSVSAVDSIRRTLKQNFDLDLKDEELRDVSWANKPPDS